MNYGLYGEFPVWCVNQHEREHVELFRLIVLAKSAAKREGRSAAYVGLSLVPRPLSFTDLSRTQTSAGAVGGFGNETR